MSAGLFFIAFILFGWTWKHRNVCFIFLNWLGVEYGGLLVFVLGVDISVQFEQAPAILLRNCALVGGGGLEVGSPFDTWHITWDKRHGHVHPSTATLHDCHPPISSVPTPRQRCCNDSLPKPSKQFDSLIFITSFVLFSGVYLKKEKKASSCINHHVCEL